MWCIGELTVEYRRRMYELLALLCSPLRSARAGDLFGREKQAIAAGDSSPLAGQAGNTGQGGLRVRTGRDLQHLCRRGASRSARLAQVTARRTKVDFVGFVCRCLHRGIPKHARSTWSWTTSTRICARASKKCSV